jgi:hypothetical protein
LFLARLLFRKLRDMSLSISTHVVCEPAAPS